MFLLNKNLLNDLAILRLILGSGKAFLLLVPSLLIKLYVVGVGLIKVYKALIGLARGALSIPLLMSMPEAFFVPFSLP